MGYPVRIYRDHPHEISEKEIERLKEHFATGNMALEDFEDRVMKWLYWETLDGQERHEFEMANELPQSLRLKKIPAKRGWG